MYKWACTSEPKAQASANSFQQLHLALYDISDSRAERSAAEQLAEEKQNNFGVA